MIDSFGFDRFHSWTHRFGRHRLVIEVIELVLLRLHVHCTLWLALPVLAPDPVEALLRLLQDVEPRLLALGKHLDFLRTLR